MHKRTAALAISKKVKDRVYQRDDGCCVWCGKPGIPEAHFIPRSLGGLGIEQNILTLCRSCHDRYDRSPDRKKMKDWFREYLRSMYENWNEEELIYRK